jgi:hypothetical protein
MISTQPPLPYGRPDTPHTLPQQRHRYKSIHVHALSTSTTRHTRTPHMPHMPNPRIPHSAVNTERTPRSIQCPATTASHVPSDAQPQQPPPHPRPDTPHTLPPATSCKFHIHAMLASNTRNMQHAHTTTSARHHTRIARPFHASRTRQPHNSRTQPSIRPSPSHHSLTRTL